jgi:hypothetical protein
MDPPSPIDTLEASAGRWASQLPGADEDGEEGAENEVAVGVRGEIRCGGTRSKTVCRVLRLADESDALTLATSQLPPSPAAARAPRGSL